MLARKLFPYFLHLTAIFLQRQIRGCRHTRRYRIGPLRFAQDSMTVS